MASVAIIPATASATVMPSRSPIRSETGTRKEWLTPKSPLRPSWTMIGSATVSPTRARGFSAAIGS